MDKPRFRQSFWWVFVVVFGLTACMFVNDYNNVQGVPISEMTSAQIVTANMDPVAEIAYRVVNAAIYGLVFGWPIHAYRRHRWRKQQEAASTLDVEPATPTESGR